jgi:membrane protein implicated in regulation of membrane protease activity
MVWFLGLGFAGLVVLVVALLFDGVLEGLFGGVHALNGLFDSLISLPVVAGFVSMLGFTGAIVTGTTGLGPVAAGAVAVPAALLTAWGAYRAGKALMTDGSGAAPRERDVVGVTGVVVTAISAGGYGEVMVRLAGQPVKLAARADRPLPRGTQVWVDQSLSSTSISVRPVED